METKYAKARERRVTGTKQTIRDGVAVCITKHGTIIERAAWDQLFTLHLETWPTWMRSGNTCYARLRGLKYEECKGPPNPTMARIIVLLFGMVPDPTGRFNVKYRDGNRANLMRSNLMVVQNPMRPGGKRARGSDRDWRELLARVHIAEKHGWKWPEPWVDPNAQRGRQ